jgi:hypothetical protein
MGVAFSRGGGGVELGDFGNGPLILVCFFV